MNIINILISLIDVLVVLIPMLLSVAFMTIIERKQLAAHQRRVGPNYVGFFGILQPFADALKLILKETIVPSQANKIIFYFSPVSTLIFSLLG
jgi:NADH-ubiquinone oxidoreductase chain 1